MGRIATRLILWLYRNSRLSIEDRILCTTALLEKLQALPAKDIIKLNDDGRLIVNDRPLELEAARLLRESARFVLESPARQFVREQVAFRAINVGIHKGETPEQLFFSKAALWQGQQEDELYRLLAQE